MKAALPLVLGMFILSGCATSICVDNIDFGENKTISLDSRPLVSEMDKVLDKTVSVGGEARALKAYVQNDHYYLEYHKVRSFNKQLYGPYMGDPLEDLKCAE